MKIQKIVASSGIIFSAALVFAALVFAATTTWSPGGPPEAAPGAGTVELNWQSAGANIFRATGNVGIGTTAPTVKLDIAGKIKASGTICDSNGCIGSGGDSYVKGGLYGHCAQTRYGGNSPYRFNNEILSEPAYFNRGCLCRSGFTPVRTGYWRENSGWSPGAYITSYYACIKD